MPPIDSLQDMRGEMLGVMGEMGIEPEKHHHEVAPSQHELGIKFTTLTRCGDAMQIYKYVIHQVAAVVRQDGDVHAEADLRRQRLGHACPPVDLEGRQAAVRRVRAMPISPNMCLYYIGGIIKHAKAINAFTNSLTNSYKRLIPGFEAPVLLAYSARNRSASCRIPFAPGPKGKRVEVRFPDPGSNPYLAYAAMLMAGLDGIENKIHPGDPMDKDLYALPPEELKDVPQVCGSLREALSPSRRQPRLPQEGRRLHRRLHRHLYRAQDGRGVRASSTRRTRSSSRCTIRSNGVGRRTIRNRKGAVDVRALLFSVSNCRARAAWRAPAATLAGSTTMARVPLPGSDSIQARPPCSSHRPRTSARPSPVPPDWRS